MASDAERLVAWVTLFPESRHVFLAKVSPLASSCVALDPWRPGGHGRGVPVSGHGARISTRRAGRGSEAGGSAIAADPYLPERARRPRVALADARPARLRAPKGCRAAEAIGHVHGRRGKTRFVAGHHPVARHRRRD